MGETTTVPMDDAALFSAATAAPEATEAATEQTIPAAPVEAEPVADATGRLHAPDGKFVPKEQATPAEAAPTQQQPVTTEQPSAPKPETDATVPSWRLREIREQREDALRQAEQVRRENEALRRQVQEFTAKPQEPVDFFTDPDAALKQQLSPIEARMQSMAQSLTLRASKAEAIASHGKQAVTDMETAIGEAMKSGHPDMPLLRAQMLQSDDPASIAMQWFQRERVIKETGGDISSYKSKVQDEALKDPAFLARALEAAKAAQVNPEQKIVLPPSLNRAASASRTSADDSGDLSDASLFRHAMR